MAYASDCIGQKHGAIISSQRPNLPPNAADDPADKPGLYHKAARAFKTLSDGQKRHIMACYYAMISESMSSSAV